jgi:hypothetical protein
MAHPYWNYFLSVEDDLERCFRFVEPVADNFETYSVEFVKVLLSASAEVDVVCRLLCKEIKPGYRGAGIGSHRKQIIGKYPKFHRIQVRVPRCDMTIAPWSAWAEDKNPDWWQSYNNVKHKRYRHFHEASLRNAIHSTSALFSVLLYLYSADLDELVPTASLFSVAPHPSLPFSRVRYALPDFIHDIAPANNSLERTQPGRDNVAE